MPSTAEQAPAHLDVGDARAARSATARSLVSATNAISAITDDAGASSGALASGGRLRRHALQPLGDALARERLRGVPVELDPHDRDARRRRRAHAPHAGRAVAPPVSIGKRDQALDLLGGHAGRLGHDRDARRGQVGEDVDRHAARRGRRRRRAAPRPRRARASDGASESRRSRSMTRRSSVDVTVRLSPPLGRSARRTRCAPRVTMRSPASSPAHDRDAARPSAGPCAPARCVEVLAVELHVDHRRGRRGRRSRVRGTTTPREVARRREGSRRTRPPTRSAGSGSRSA